jgi:hypothetical protein
MELSEESMATRPVVDGVVGCVKVKVLLDGGSDPDAISEDFYNQNANDF